MDGLAGLKAVLVLHVVESEVIFEDNAAKNKALAAGFNSANRGKTLFEVGNGLASVGDFHLISPALSSLDGDVNGSHVVCATVGGGAFRKLRP